MSLHERIARGAARAAGMAIGLCVCPACFFSVALRCFSEQCPEPPWMPGATVTVRRAVERIRLDGRLTEDSWLLATRLPIRLVHPGAETNDPAGYFVMTYDEDRLYVGFDIADTNLQARGSGRDQADVNPPNDLAMVFLDLNNDPEHIIELHVNPLGAVNDIFCLAPRNESPMRHRLKWGLMFISRWDIDGCAAAVSRRGTVNRTGDMDRGWSGEVSIPFSGLMMPAGRPRPDERDLWRVQFAIQRGEEEKPWMTWMPSLEPWFHHGVEKWGKVIFRGD